MDMLQQRAEPLQTDLIDELPANLREEVSAAGRLPGSRRDLDEHSRRL